jgi:hypothetical protein
MLKVAGLHNAMQNHHEALGAIHKRYWNEVERMPDLDEHIGLMYMISD